MPERTLTAALAAARAELIQIAAAAITTAGAIIPDPGPTAAEVERAERDGAIIAAAVVLVEAVSAAMLTAEHFTGVYEPLLAPLADLGFAVEAQTGATP